MGARNTILVLFLQRHPRPLPQSLLLFQPPSQYTPNRNTKSSNPHQHLPRRKNNFKASDSPPPSTMPSHQHDTQPSTPDSTPTYPTTNQYINPSALLWTSAFAAVAALIHRIIPLMVLSYWPFSTASTDENTFFAIQERSFSARETHGLWSWNLHHIEILLSVLCSAALYLPELEDIGLIPKNMAGFR